MSWELALAAAPLLVWLIGLTYEAGKLRERLTTIIGRLDKGDSTFAQIREEQSTMSHILVELRTIREHESKRLVLLERQTRAVLETLAQWRGAAAAKRAVA